MGCCRHFLIYDTVQPKSNKQFILSSITFSLFTFVKYEDNFGLL